MRILGGLDWVLRLGSHKFKVKVLAGLLSGNSGEESTSRFITFVGRIQFFAVGGLRSSFPCWLSARLYSQFLKTPFIPWHEAPPSPANNDTLNPLWALNL